MKRLGRDRYGYAYDPALPPVLTVQAGERFLVETNDAHRGTVTDTGAVYSSLEDVLERLGGANPVAGPIAVAGARPGDCLRIGIESIAAAPRTGTGYTCTTSRVEEGLEPESVLCRHDGDHVLLPTARGPLSLPLRPMLGTLGVAPPEGARPSFGQGVDVLGNVDLPELTAGATVVVPVHHEGALLYLGDAHLAQGDAEIHRAAIEAEADVTLWAEPVAREDVGYGELPQLDDERSLGCVCCGPEHLEQQLRRAYADLAGRLERGYGLSRADAWRLLGAAGRVTVGQVVPPVFSVRASIERSLLPPPAAALPSPSFPASRSQEGGA